MSEDKPESGESVPSAVRYRLPWVTWPGVVLLLAGLGIVLFGNDGVATGVVLRQKAGIKLPTLDTPDYYLVIVTDSESVKTSVKEDPIGDGLAWDFDEPLPLASSREVQVYDEDTLGDDFLDRSSITGRKGEGQDYKFELLGHASQLEIAGVVAVAVGGLLTLVVLVRFIWQQAI